MGSTPGDRSLTASQMSGFVFDPESQPCITAPLPLLRLCLRDTPVDPSFFLSGHSVTLLRLWTTSMISRVYNLRVRGAWYAQT